MNQHQLILDIDLCQTAAKSDYSHFISLLKKGANIFSCNGAVFYSILRSDFYEAYLYLEQQQLINEFLYNYGQVYLQESMLCCNNKSFASLLNSYSDLLLKNQEFIDWSIKYAFQSGNHYNFFPFLNLLEKSNLIDTIDWDEKMPHLNTGYEKPHYDEVIFISKINELPHTHPLYISFNKNKNNYFISLFQNLKKDVIYNLLDKNIFQLNPFIEENILTLNLFSSFNYEKSIKLLNHVKLKINLQNNLSEIPVLPKNNDSINKI